MTVIRIAILECDTPIESIRSTYPSYAVAFQKLLKAGLEAVPEGSTIEPSYTSWDVVTAKQYPVFGEYDALLLTGSKHNSFDNDEWIVKLVDYVRRAYESEIPLVGICFGHQIIARATGGQVVRSSNGWEVAVNEVNLGSRGKELFGKDTLALHQMHRDAVIRLPPNIENLGSSPACSIQGLYQAKRVFTTQAHPEFNEYIMAKVLVTRHSQGIFDDAFYHEAAPRAGLHHDGVVVASAIWKFLLTGARGGN